MQSARVLLYSRYLQAAQAQLVAPSYHGATAQFAYLSCYIAPQPRLIEQ